MRIAVYIIVASYPAFTVYIIVTLPEMVATYKEMVAALPEMVAAYDIWNTCIPSRER